MTRLTLQFLRLMKEVRDELGYLPDDQLIKARDNLEAAVNLANRLIERRRLRAPSRQPLKAWADHYQPNSPADDYASDYAEVCARG